MGFKRSNGKKLPKIEAGDNMLHIVLFQPEIPQNTGNIMRTCVGIGAKLHLIKPLGFNIDDAKLRRSAVDYYDHLAFDVYENWQAFIDKNQGQYFFLTRYGRKAHSEIDFSDIKEEVYLVFGKESTGIDKDILKDHLENCYRIPMNDKIRSLNLSNTVAICAYEYMRQLNFPNLLKEEPAQFKGADYLEKKEMV